MKEYFIEEERKSNRPGYRVADYKIILTPHEELAKKIMEVQKDFNGKFKLENSKVYVPQLILVSFKQMHVFEQRIINRLKIMSMGFHPIKIEIKNLGSIPSHTIYFAVTSKEPVKELVTKIREESQRLMKLDKDNKPHFIMDANLTLARKLKPWQYEQAWTEYSHYDFTGRFVADKMILLRKREEEYRFSPIETFHFQNLPVDIKQGQLF